MRCAACSLDITLVPLEGGLTFTANSDDGTPHRLTCPNGDRRLRRIQEHDCRCPCTPIGLVRCQVVWDRAGAVHTCLSCKGRRYAGHRIHLTNGDLGIQERLT
ncbi:MAG TPA: hypothetical protein VII57_06005 [Dehalococcoidia bacterium]